jgi:hypothetical protein
MKEQIKKLMRQNGMVAAHEVEAAINLVADLLYAFADDTEENEPHATRSIQEMREAASRVSELQLSVSDALDS